MISNLANIPEPLHRAVNDYLDQHTEWDRDRVFTASLALFLMQNGGSSQAVSEIYLSSLFDQPEVAA